MVGNGGVAIYSVLHFPSSTLRLGGQTHSCVSLKITQAYRFKWAISWELLVLES